jgi:hypothetical protein
MAFLKHSNFGYSTLNGGILIGAGTLTVQGGHGARFPSAGNFPCVLWDQAYSNPLLDTSRELVLCTARSTDTLTITRAQEGTSAKGWNSGDKVAMVASSAFFTQVETEIGLKAPLASPTFTGQAKFAYIDQVTDIYSSNWTAFHDTSTINGWSSISTKYLYYKTIGKNASIYGYITGTGNGVSTSFTIPVVPSNSFGSLASIHFPILIHYSSGFYLGSAMLQQSSQTVSLPLIDLGGPTYYIWGNGVSKTAYISMPFIPLQ